MSPALANFLFEVANFTLLAAALGAFLFKPVRAAIDAERSQRAEDEADMARRRAEAEALSTKASLQLEKIEQEAERRYADALARAGTDIAVLREQASKQEQAERERFTRELAALRRAELARTARQVGLAAAGAVRTLLDSLDGPSLDSALVRGACAELSHLPEKARSPALVETSRPIASDARELLGSVLPQGFEERAVPELGAGVRVTTPAGQVDASALALADHAARKLAAQLDQGPAA